jgi:hypothetical protein
MKQEIFKKYMEYVFQDLYPNNSYEDNIKHVKSILRISNTIHKDDIINKLSYIFVGFSNRRTVYHCKNLAKMFYEQYIEKKNGFFDKFYKSKELNEYYSKATLFDEKDFICEECVIEDEKFINGSGI